jgi:hypothetical protein
MFKTIDSLELTIDADSKIIQRLKSFNNKRNQSVYDVAGSVSDQDLTEMSKLTVELYKRVKAWLKESHPELLKE